MSSRYVNDCKINNDMDNRSQSPTQNSYKQDNTDTKPRLSD